MKKEEILKKLEIQRLNKELEELDDFESYIQARNELQPEFNKLGIFSFKKLRRLEEKVFERSREIFREKYKEVLEK